MKDCLKHVDKNSVKHFGVCFGLSLLFGWAGFFTALGAGVTKEWCDKEYGNHWCWADLGFDILGMVAGILINHWIL